MLLILLFAGWSMVQEVGSLVGWGRCRSIGGCRL